jgi:ribose/xylose/arabinose/galactoside ABC-type transport system permease subunit
LKAYNVAVVNLEPGFVATERMTMVMQEHGIDASAGLPVDVPGSVCAYIAGHPTPMTFSGRTVDAPQMASWMQLLDASTFPHPYGPSNWGYPPVVPIGGTATGVGSGVP